MRRRFVGLCLPAMIFCVLDTTLTLVRQSAQYWGGDYSQADERSPTFEHLLRISPLVDVAGTVVWIGVFVGIILLLPDILALIVSIAVTLGHAVGACTWVWEFEAGYQICNGLILLAAVVLVLGIRYGWQAKPTELYCVSMPSFRRWLLTACLFAIGLYLFLWPH